MPPLETELQHPRRKNFDLRLVRSHHDWRGLEIPQSEHERFL
jgi:hypothetical protein